MRKYKYALREALCKVMMLFVVLSIIGVLAMMARAEVSAYTNSIELTATPLYRINSLIRYYDDENDYVPEGKPFKVIVNYECEDISLWNSNYPQYRITSLQLFISESHIFKQAGLPTNITNINRTIDLMAFPKFSNQKLFFSLNHNDALQVFIDTRFENKSVADSPCSFYIQSPTWSCNACDDYEYQVLESNIAEGSRLNAMRDRVYSFVIRLLQLNFELIAIIFWIILIAVFLGVIGFIIYLIFWVYKMLKGWLR